MRKHIFISACILLCCAIAQAGDWVMFADGKDTYIYSTATGEIYIRYHKGGKNYEDVFVKMSRGVLANELKDTHTQSSTHSNTTNTYTTEQLKNMQLNAIKKSQEMLNSALE